MGELRDVRFTKQFFGVSGLTVRKWIARRKIPALKIQRKWYIPDEYFLNLLYDKENPHFIWESQKQSQKLKFFTG